MMFSYEDNVKNFTKYINECLKNSIIVDTWGIYISGNDKYEMYVEIDYLDDFHSRDMFYILPTSDLDVLKCHFDEYFNRHLIEYIQKEEINMEEINIIKLLELIKEGEAPGRIKVDGSIYTLDSENNYMDGDGDSLLDYLDGMINSGIDAKITPIEDEPYQKTETTYSNGLPKNSTIELDDMIITIQRKR